MLMLTPREFKNKRESGDAIEPYQMQVFPHSKGISSISSRIKHERNLRKINEMCPKKSERKETREGSDDFFPRVLFLVMLGMYINDRNQSKTDKV